MDINFCEFDESFYVLSGKWLQDPEIKKLTMAKEITEEERRKWFHSLQSRDDYYIEGIKMGEKSIGVAGMKHIDTVHSIGEYFGYIGEKKYLGGVLVN